MSVHVFKHYKKIQPTPPSPKKYKQKKIKKKNKKKLKNTVTDGLKYSLALVNLFKRVSMKSTESMIKIRVKKEKGEISLPLLL